MTRETKIGLLVGLAFIIVIGILLSDHLTSSTEPPPATLANAGSNVMQTLSTPGGANVPAVTSTPPPQQVTPDQTVPTRADLSGPRPQPVQIVQIGPGSTGGGEQGSPISVRAQQPAPEPQPQERAAQPDSPVITMTQTPGHTIAADASTPPGSVTDDDDDSPLITQVPTYVDNSLAQTAQRNGEALVTLDGAGRPTVENATAPTWTEALTGMREHKAEPGDSVSRMAARFLGGNTKGNRDLIVRANPSLQKNPDRVIVGQTYLIPTVGSGTPAESTASAMPEVQPPPPPTVETATGPTVASATEYIYTVREGDSLWKIANEQLGKPSAVAAIKELNKDTLRGGDTVYVGMKLKLPGRPVAQATN